MHTQVNVGENALTVCSVHDATDCQDAAQLRAGCNLQAASAVVSIPPGTKSQPPSTSCNDRRASAKQSGCDTLPASISHGVSRLS